MTTDEWEALLAGTTPGPWNAGKEEIYGPYYAEVLAAETETRGSGYMAYEAPRLAGERLDRDLPLAAAAPDAVAEVIRLRKAIAAVRDDYLAHIADYDEATVTHMCYGTAADTLTRILEGDTNE